MRKMFLIALGVGAFCAIVFVSQSDIYAQRVQAFKCEGARCTPENNFKPTDDVFARLRGFQPNSPVWIWVTINRRWRFGDRILDSWKIWCLHVDTDRRGRYLGLICLAGTLPPGYGGDMVVDANQNGIFDRGDAVFGGGDGPGLRVRTR